MVISSASMAKPGRDKVTIIASPAITTWVSGGEPTSFLSESTG